MGPGESPEPFAYASKVRCWVGLGLRVLLSPGPGAAAQISVIMDSSALDWPTLLTKVTWQPRDWLTGSARSRAA